MESCIPCGPIQLNHHGLGSVWVLNLKLCKSNIGRTVCLLYNVHVYASGKCGICNTVGRRRIRLIESNAICRYLKKLTCKGTLRQVLILSPPLLGFCMGWCSNFVGSESGQKQSVKLLQNMVSNTTQHLHPLPATHCLHIVYTEL